MITVKSKVDLAHREDLKKMMNLLSDKTSHTCSK